MLQYTPTTGIEKINNIQNKHEREIALLIQNLGFNYITSNFKLFDNNKVPLGEIDLIFQYERHLFLIDVTAQSRKVHTEAGSWFSKWSSEDNIKKIFKKLNLSRQKIFKIWIDLSHESSSSNLSSLSHHLIDKYNIYLFNDDIEYFKDCYNQIGIYTRNDFLNLIGFPRKTSTRIIKGIKFYINEKPVYSFIAPVNELLETCYIQRRLGNKGGYQRALKYRRIRSIRKDIINKKILAFPNAIILNSNMKLSHDDPKEEDCPKIVDINLPLGYCEFKVVDGQHRLLGFTGVGEDIQNNSFLPVIAFENLPNTEEIKMFVDINSKQKRVDRNLVYLLKTEFAWQESDKEYYEKIAVEIAETLKKNGPLKNRIYMGTAKEKTSRNKVTLSTIVSILCKNGFLKQKNALWQKTPNDIKTPLAKTRNVLKNIKFNLSEYSVSDIEPFFLSNMGLRLLFILISIFEKNRRVGLVNSSNEEIIEDISKIVDEAIMNEIRSSYGEGGANNSAKHLCSILKQRFDVKYNELELDLVKLAGMLRRTSREKTK